MKLWTSEKAAAEWEQSLQALYFVRGSYLNK